MNAQLCNEIVCRWDRSTPREKMAMTGEFLALPKSYVALTSPTTGYPVLCLTPFGTADMPVKVALWEARKMGIPTSPVHYRGRWYDNVEEIEA